MKLLWKTKLLSVFIINTLILFGLSAQDIPEPMYPYRLVNDFANLFSQTEQQALEQKLLAYNDSTSTQIYVVTVNDLHGYAASDFAIRLGEKWDIGQRGKDNGAVILIKPKVGNSRGQAFISVGYGLEARINDAFAGRIVRNEMIPHFAQNDYFSGTNAAIDTMIARLSGEFSADPQEDGVRGFSILTIIVFIIIFLVLVRLLSNGGDQHIDGDGHSRGRGGGPIFFPPITGGGRRSSGWGGGGFGGGGFGGGSFGGFGGGGGGSFGGGGAGGSW